MTNKKKTKAKPKSKAKRKKPRPNSRNSDKHVLYQASVQAVDVEVDFLNRIFRNLRKRAPRSLLEDFCGTALLCREWVQRSPTRTASGVDIDRAVLSWGKRELVKDLGEVADRIKLYQCDVRDRIPGRFDVAVALNFSYWVFKTREDLRKYFENVHRHLGPEGIFFIDAYGGSEAWEQIEERRRVKGGFTYVWDQHSFDPITHDIVNHIHFEFKDKSKWNFAFSYYWRFWTLPELREVLEEAGFSKVHVYWDHASGNEEEDFRPTRHVKTQPGFITYLVALR